MAVAIPFVAAGISAYGALKSGSAKSQAAKSEALQIERNASNEYAAGQQTAAEKRREGAIVASNAAAAIAASGGVTTDAGSSEIISKIKAEGDYNSLATLYDERERYLGSKNQAAATRREGKNARNASRIQAASSVASAFGSYYGGK